MVDVWSWIVAGRVWSWIVAGRVWSWIVAGTVWSWIVAGRVLVVVNCDWYLFCFLFCFCSWILIGQVLIRFVTLQIG